MKKHILFLALFQITLVALIHAQPRFRGGIIAGVSASQIDGDESARYNKLGFVGGLRVISRLKQRTEASIEFLYAQRGSQTELIKDQTNPFGFSLTMNYVEVPLQWHYKDWLVKGESDDEDYYKVSFNAGLSYARFIGSKDRDFAWTQIVPDYINKNDVSMLLGANFFANRHVGFTFRYVRSLTYMYDPRDFANPPYRKGWLGHCLYFQTVYLL